MPYSEEKLKQHPQLFAALIDRRGMRLRIHLVSAIPQLLRLGVCLTVALISATSARAQGPVITTRQDSVGRLLEAWEKEKSAAGLQLIQYENRDGQHSPLNLTQYPGLKVFQFSEADKAAGRDKGPANMIRPEPTIGNCSMAAHPTAGGSLTRLYYTQPGGLMFLNQQYLSNNLIIYPEHLDHDPGGNGVGGWGDLFPTNSACVITSQGSSFTDQPFLNAVLTTVAAFDPDVLTLLIRKRMLMPTVQSIFRQSNKMVKTEQDYFTAKAHPVVFDGTQIDEEKMVLTAHGMTRAAIPPVVVLKVVSESESKPGRDYFELPSVTTDKLADTPTVISRIFRSHASTHEMVISSAGTGDLLNRPTQIKCQLLQGDPKLVTIEPDPATGQFKIRVKWHMPMTTATGIRSHRVDIGVFATNGVSVSAPAFVTFYMLPSEVRSYDAAGRVSEIYYAAPNPDIGLPVTTTDARWLEVFAAITQKSRDIRSEIMEQAFSDVQRAFLAKLHTGLSARFAAIEKLKPDEKQKDLLAKLQQALDQDLAAALTGTAPEAKGTTLRQMIERGFETIASHTPLFTTLQKQIETLAPGSGKPSAPGDLATEVKRLLDLGVLIQEAKGKILTVHPQDQLTSGERYQLRALNLTIMSQILYPKALDRSLAPAYVDPRFTTVKPWRDWLRYDAKGDLAGWVRYLGGRTYRFDADGRLLPEGSVKPEKALPVTYRDDGKGGLTFLP